MKLWKLQNQCIFWYALGHVWPLFSLIFPVLIIWKSLSSVSINKDQKSSLNYVVLEIHSVSKVIACTHSFCLIHSHEKVTCCSCQIANKIPGAFYTYTFLKVTLVHDYEWTSFFQKDIKYGWYKWIFIFLQIV